MENEQLLDDNFNFNASSGNIEVHLCSPSKFVILYFFSFGIYGNIWAYRLWKFFKTKEKLDIIPWARGLFILFFIFQLFEKILPFAKKNGYSKSYYYGALFIGFLLFTLLSRLPDPFWLISFLAFIVFLQPLKAFNYAIRNSEIYNESERANYSKGDIVLLLFGILFWFLILVGIFIPVD